LRQRRYQRPKAGWRAHFIAAQYAVGVPTPATADKSPSGKSVQARGKVLIWLHSRRRDHNEIKSRNPAGRTGLVARPGRRKHPALYLVLSRRNAGILSEVSALAAADCRPVCTGRVAASPFPLQLLEDAPPDTMVRRVCFRGFAGLTFGRTNFADRHACEGLAGGIGKEWLCPQ
jgi:hypothetical protein